MKALIPAAGLGTRWYPWSRIVPKELLPLSNHPVLYYILEEAVSAGISEIGIIISESKELIKRYVEDIWRSDHPAISVQLIYQPSPRGIADALICSCEWVKHEPVAVLYPDEIHPPRGGINKLKEAYESAPGTWIGLTETKQERSQSILEIQKNSDSSFMVTGYARGAQTLNIGFGTGRYILNSGSISRNRDLLQAEKTDAREMDDDKIFEPLWQQGVCGIVLPEPIYDVGTPLNWQHCIKKWGIKRL